MEPFQKKKVFGTSTTAQLMEVKIIMEIGYSLSKSKENIKQTSLSLK